MTGNGSTTIGQTAAQVAAREIHKKDISMIRIVEAEAEGGKLYSVDNRRLGVFRLLEMTGKTKIVKVEAVAMSDLHKKEWRDKFSTQTDGLIIEVSGGNGQIGTTRSNTTYPLPSTYPSLSSSWSMEDLESEDETGPATKRSRVAWEWQGWSGEVDGVMVFAMFAGVEMQLGKVREVMWKGKIQIKHVIVIGFGGCFFRFKDSRESKRKSCGH